MYEYSLYVCSSIVYLFKTFIYSLYVGDLTEIIISIASNLF